MSECAEQNRGLKLTALDRCDRCSARAAVATMSASGSVLLWCTHHYTEYSGALVQAGAVIVTDDR
jgi:hypothetical protein